MFFRVHSFIFILALSFNWVPVLAQGKWAVSTNVIDYADGGTLNMDASVSLSSHWTVGGGVRYNPYNILDKQRSFSFGAKYWPWYVYSGWWISGHANYQEFSASRKSLREGDRYGAGLRIGYSRMLSKHFNLELGWGLWAGYELYKVYGCQKCARIQGEGTNYFVAPDQVMLSVAYIF